MKLKRLVWGGGIKGTSVFPESIGFRPGGRFAVMAGLSEFLGGWLVALGLLNPAGSLLMISVMLIAIVTVHLEHGYFATEQWARAWDSCP